MKREVLALLTMLGLPLIGGCDEDMINPMAARQPRVQNYRESDFFDDGIAMRAPPEGTVPRERITGIPGINTGFLTAPDGKITYLATIPVPVTHALMALGRKRFDITCATCHGPLGDGESIVARQMALRPPPSLHKYIDRQPGYIFAVATQGFGLMASYAGELPVNERWAVVAYIRALQKSQAATLESVPPGERVRLEKEKQ